MWEINTLERFPVGLSNTRFTTDGLGGTCAYEEV